MNIEIKIGREVDGGTALRVAPNHKRVSRQHAIFRWQDGVATLEDTESSYGTFVNGRRIAKTKVTEDDVVWLGGINGGDDCFQLDMKKLFASCHEATDAQRTDYTDEFENIKQAYIDYQAEVSELKKKVAKESQMPKILASIIPAIIGLVILCIPSIDMTIRFVVMGAGTVISGLVSFLTLGKSGAANEKLTEEITELQIKYQKDYKCPKCGKDFNLNTHWRKLEAAGKCPHGCGAKFV